jgi:hypothetical protein
MKRQSSFLTKELPPKRKKLENLNRGRDDRPGRPIDTFPVQGSKIAIGRWGPSPLPRFKREHSTAPSPCNSLSTAVVPSPRADFRPRTRLGRLCGPSVFEVTRPRVSASRNRGMQIASSLIRRLKGLRSKHLHQQVVVPNQTQSLT